VVASMVALSGPPHTMTAAAGPRYQEDMEAEAASAPATRDPHQGRGWARAESRDAMGRGAAETPAGGDSAPEGLIGCGGRISPRACAWGAGGAI
jgi:hypothetical protein